MHTLLEAENQSMILGKNKIKELVTVPRNRRAMQASEIVMFMQRKIWFSSSRAKLTMNQSSVA